MRVSLKDIREAFEFVCASEEHQAFLSKQSGELYYHYELCDDLDSLPDDMEPARGLGCFSALIKQTTEER